MGVYDFKKDLIEGQKAEEEVLALIKKKYKKAYRIEGYFKDYDIYVPEVDKRLEVKFDKRVEKSGNYFIETEYNSKESGILTTKADYWIEVDEDSIIIIKLEVLKYILQDCRIVTLPPKKTSLGAKGYLMSKNKLIFSPYAAVINKLNKEVKLYL